VAFTVAMCDQKGVGAENKKRRKQGKWTSPTTTRTIIDKCL